MSLLITNIICWFGFDVTIPVHVVQNIVFPFIIEQNSDCWDTTRGIITSVSYFGLKMDNIALIITNLFY